MTALHALILGIIQGVGEFLPISSSGHLVLVQKLFGVNEGALSFDIIVHLGTLISLCAVMRKRLFAYLRNPFGHMPKMVVLGTIPTVIIAFAFGRFFKALFETGISLGIGFLYTAVMLFIAENHIGDTRNDNDGHDGHISRFGHDGIDGYDGIVGHDGIDGRAAAEKRVTPKGALIVGIAQGIAVVPAISRSGSTIAAGVISDFGKGAAIEFAFLMSIPVTLLAVAQDALSAIADRGVVAAGAVARAAGGGAGGGVGGAGAADIAGAATAAGAAAAGPVEMAIGFAAAAITGYFAARFMLTAIKKIKLTWFSLYVGALGVLILIDQVFIGAVFDKLF